MTIWKPALGKSDIPRYLAIADAIARDVETDVLKPGDRLPTHRELAKSVGVTVGTVTRAYAEASRRGLTSGEVGRGTYVRGRESSSRLGRLETRRSETAQLLDMTLASPWQPPDGQEGKTLAKTLVDLARDGDLDRLLGYNPDGSTETQREIAASWIATHGVPSEPDRIVATVGAQQGLAVILSSLLRPGDTLLTEELTYPALRSLAQQFGVRTHGVAMDEEGLVPEALARACKATGARALFCVPTVQNPTSRVFSQARREAIAAAARQFDLHVIEDGVHVPITGRIATPIAALAPERTIYLATLSKWVAIGLRTGFLSAPAAVVERLRSGVRTMLWMPPPLMIEIATRWIADGTAQRLGERKVQELEARQRLVSEILGSHWRVEHHPRGLQAWLHLPEPWRQDEFAAAARQRGVLVAGSELFAVGRREVPHAVRIAISAPRSRELLRAALVTIADLLAREPGAGMDVL
jgi:DNA-binding transcriptional MocR family regulator